ncbi:MAG: phage baseplate protein, partial [Lactococcus raffinolactis]|nr:phage baseplate protein [Lactococcus raffinolactis]
MTSRKFLLYNSEDDLVDLNNHEIFVFNPTGLGVSFSNSFSNVSANFLQEKSVLNSASLKLDIIFSRNSTTPYEKYEEFVKFLNKPPFKLIYEISGKTFQRDCVLSELSKGEIVTNVLAESLTLDFTTPFYKEISETYKPNSDAEGDGKIYAGINKPRNLIANPNFLNNMQDWSNTSDPEGTYQLQAPASDKPNSNILKLTSSNNKLSSFINAWGLKAKKGERLSFRVDIKTENNPDYDRPVIRVGYGTGEKNYKYSDFGVTSSSSGFKTATISFIVPEDGVFQLYLINQNWSTMGEMSTYFREPMLIRGDVENLPADQYDDSYPNLNLITNTKTQSYTSTGTATNVSASYYLISGNKSDIENKQVTISYKYLITNSAGIWSGTIRPAYGMGGANQLVSNTNLSGTHKETVTLGGVWPTSYAITVTGLPAGTTVTINNLKVEFGSTATPWMPSASEVQPSDYPSFLSGFYEGKQSNNYYAYQFVYESDYNGKSGVFQIENNSVYISSAKGSPVEITVHGPCTNPYWEILDGSKVLQ